MRRNLVVRACLTSALVVPSAIAIQGCTGSCAMSLGAAVVVAANSHVRDADIPDPDPDHLHGAGCSNPTPSTTFPTLHTLSPTPNVRSG
jgi:hypothetical protein